MSDSLRSVPDWVVRLIAEAKSADGAPPFSDQALVDYRSGARDLVAIGEDAAGIASATEAEFVVAPDARGRGLGTGLLETLLGRGATLFWAHGDAPAARALAASHGLTAIRQLLHLVGEVSLRTGFAGEDPSSTRDVVSADTRVETFLLGHDEDEWVALNAKTFARHPEQGAVTKSDVEQLETEAWFSSDNFLVLRRDGRMIGYCWLKVEGGRGEFYVVGVDPDHQGEHLGALLFDAGLARLAELGIHDAHLYVEADNEPALRLYRARGFAQDSIDIQYSAHS
jgi:mycothiol synthase